MDAVIRFAVIIGGVLFLSLGLEAGLFNDILDLAVPKKYLHVEDWHVDRCGIDNDDFELQDIQVSVNKWKEEIVVSGKVHVRTFLSTPVTAKVSMKSEVLGVWVRVPCIKDFGSCTYEDLCIYGYDEDTTCPESFVQDHVPCRCPIKKGLYNIPSDLRIQAPSTRWGALVNGKYKAIVQFVHNNSEIGCYIASFTLQAIPK
ncbi:ganglioside GM2 activator-like [Zootermopsis nevadensis]|uniref:Ganglioside GM2 activator n=1 Tax=Zootermopsis nevadensis TaxID=136037 RepID=A0A067R3H4_ZOONE|nr:ganglioside GM2 activator-like [Zootermopsis nevadensis]KDR17702.1 Ganglioside GM2 activator [Zootermopsis nevadensis]